MLRKDPEKNVEKSDMYAPHLIRLVLVTPRVRQREPVPVGVYVQEGEGVYNRVRQRERVPVY